MSKLFDAWRARSPYYSESHEALADSVRKFMAREAIPHTDEWERAGIVPRDFHRKAGEAGLLGIGFPEAYGGTSEGIDIFHKLVLVEETAATGAGGIQAGLFTHQIALRPIIDVGSDAMRADIVPAILSGEKILAIGVTEPSGGSDVAQLKTRAERRGNDRYVVNGSKTFITNGMRADYVMTAVRTGGSGVGGISMLLIPTDSKGFSRTPLEKMGWHSSDTATLYFEDLEVPAENLIGPENEGFRHVMVNFNYERLQAAAMRGFRPPMPAGSDRLGCGARDLRQEARGAPGDPHQARRHDPAREPGAGLDRSDGLAGWPRPRFRP